MNKIGDIQRRSVQAANKAMDRMRKVTGQSGNPDVRMYKKLSSDSLQKLAGEFGQQAVMEYIRDMEYASLMGEE